MKVTEVRIRIVRDNEKEKLRAFSSLTFDNSFVVREVKVIEGDKGLFVAMPSRKVTGRCRKCGCRNVIQAQYCNNCGNRLEEYGQYRFNGGEPQQEKMYMDVAHPINAECRKMIHSAVIGAYKAEMDKINSRPSSDDYEPDAPAPAPAHEIGDDYFPQKEEGEQQDEIPPQVSRNEPVKETEDFAKGIFS